MIVPTAADVVRTMAAKFEETIMPAMESPQEKSTAQTFRHLLRYVERRIEDEGQTLLDEVFKLGELLAEMVTHFVSRDDNASKALAAAIAETLAVEEDPKRYPSLSVMAQRVGVLRQHVSDALKILNAIDENEADKALHDKIRRYIAWQIEQEGKVIQASFWGHGPRR
jgi:hypothetical protein